MGKPSKLRGDTPIISSKYSYTNGDRQLYDRNKTPEGLDSDIWELVLLFEQYAEQNGFSTPGRPIMYTELYHRVSADSDLCELLTSLHTDYTRVRNNGGICGIDDHRGNPYNILEDMIHLYWTTNNGYDYNHSINNFCSIEVFNYLKNYIVATIKRELLRTTGDRVVLRERPVKPSRRTEEEKTTFEIINVPRTEQETKEKIEHWKRDTSQPT